MIKNKVAFEKIIDGRTYVFYCDIDSPLGAIHDAICEMKAEIVNRIKSVDEQKKEESNV